MSEWVTKTAIYRYIGFVSYPRRAGLVNIGGISLVVTHADRRIHVQYRRRCFRERVSPWSQTETGSAFYVFAVFDVSSRPLTARLKRMNPADVGYIIGARGGWYNAGHVAGKEYKLPIDAVFG